MMSEQKQDNGSSLPNFYFQLNIGDAEVAFQELSGLTAEMGTEAVQKGGAKYSNIILKKALHAISPSDMKWVQNIIEGGLGQQLSTRNIVIKLLNSEGTALSTWSCENAYPVKWEIENPASEKNDVLIESIEFAYSQLKKL